MSQYSSDQKLDFTGKQCVYCGDQAEAIDHVPPQSVLKRWRLPWPQQTVYCCEFCNRTLGNRVALMTLPARKAWMRAAIWRKRLPHRRREKLFHVQAVRPLAR